MCKAGWKELRHLASEQKQNTKGLEHLVLFVKRKKIKASCLSFTVSTSNECISLSCDVQFWRKNAEPKHQDLWTCHPIPSLPQYPPSPYSQLVRLCVHQDRVNSYACLSDTGFLVGESLTSICFKHVTLGYFAEIAKENN